MRKLRLLLAEDNPIYRRGLHALLTSLGEIDVRGEPAIIEVIDATNGEEAVAKALALQPDVVVMDLQMPARPGPYADKDPMVGIDATRRITQQPGDARVLVVTVTGDDHWAREAIRAGARGYVVKDADDNEHNIRLGIQAVANGHFFLARTVADDVARLLDDGALQHVPPAFRELSKTELKIVALMAQGKENKEIARSLVLQPHTVASRISDVKRKLGVDQRELLTLALKAGMGENSVGDAASR